jgi:hypothetical protein
MHVVSKFLFCHIPLTTAHIDRPIQETVLYRSLEERGTISRLGAGWNAATCLSWFDKRAMKKDIDEKTSRNKIGEKKRLPFQPASTGRNIQTPFEMAESLIILKTLSTVRLDYDNDNGRGYSMTCDVKAAVKNNPSLKLGDHKAFYNDPTFECGNNMIISLPFEFVQKLRVGKKKSLPPKWLKDVKRDAFNSNSGQIKSIQLWRYRRVLMSDTKSSTDQIYEIEYDATMRGQSTRRTFVSDAIATQFLKSEPWTVAQVNSLCYVRNYRRLVFGEGAKTSHNEEKQVNTNIPSGRENVWWSVENHAKLCTEGCVFNMFCHMNLTDDANKFREISVHDTVADLKLAMAVTAIPKKVLDATHGVDPIEKCMWILEKRFNCRRLGYLNTARLVTAESLVNALHAIRLPMIISVVGKQSYYNHVVVAWRDEIIDFEEKFTYSVSMENVDRICGPKNPFHKVSRGYIILPSKIMKRSIGDFSDWGEKDVLEKYSHLLTR